MAEKKEKAKNRITGLRVNEISFVDNPAVPKARFVIEKRKGGEGDMPETCDACGSEMELEKQDLTSVQGESALGFLQRAVGNLMALRRSLPRQVRELLMALDLAADDVIENAASPDTAKGYIDRAANKEARGPEDKKPEEKEKKAEHQDCPPGMVFDEKEGKCVPKKETKKDKAGHKEDEKEKAGHKEDEKPMKKEDQKEDEKSEEITPDPQTGESGGLTFNEEQSSEIGKLLGQYPK